MAWGYEKSFTIEHDDTVRRRINCKDCLYYDNDDKSCMKRPLYLPEDGYNSWRNCTFFELDSSTSNSDSKRIQYEDSKKINKKKLTTKKNKKESLSTSRKSDYQTKSTTSHINKQRNVESVQKNKEIYPIGFKVHVIIGKYPPKLYIQYIDITLDTEKQIKVRVGFDMMNKKAYINGEAYTKEAIIKVIEKIG